MKTISRFTRIGARVLLAINTFQLALGLPLARAQTVPAPVPANTGTSISKSANGTPVVNIATPNSAGVSHNLFNSFNVGTGGLILDNSPVNAVSMLGGGTPGNTNLTASHSASLILNEVTSPNPSTLLGYQEILGPSAELVLANPWGITCNGCGFLNTPRVTLATGTPTLSSTGALAGFTITGGQLAIGANGLDATRQGTLDLLARSISVGGNVIVGSQANGISGDLLLLAGANRFDYATRTGTGIAGIGATPQFAIDSSLLGGMYADRIRLLVNENGAGVRLAGNLAALADDLVISANGTIALNGAASAGRDLSVGGTDIQVQLANSNTYLYGGRDLSLSATGNLDLGTGSIGALRNLSLMTVGDLVDNGSSADLRFGGSGGTLTATAGGTLNLAGGYWTAPQLLLNASSVELGPNATLYATGNLSVSGSSLANDGTVAAATIAINTTDTANSGVIQATNGLTLNSATLENTGKNASIVGATSATGSATIAAATVNNSGTLYSAGDLSLTPTTLTQQSGALVGAGRDLTLAYTGAANLGAGDLQAGRDLTITGTLVRDTGASATATTAGDLRYAGRNLDVTASPGGNVEIAGGQWFSQGDLNLTGDQVTLGLFFNPQIAAYSIAPGVQVAGAQGGSGTLALTARKGFVDLEGGASALSGGNLSVNGPNEFLLAAGSTLQATGAVSVAAGGKIDNSGTLSGGTVTLASNNGTPLTLVNESTGTVYGNQQVNIGTAAAPAGDIVVEAPASSTSGIFGGALDINAGGLFNFGTLQAVGPGSTINLGQLVNNDSGRILGFTNAGGQGGITLTTPNLNNSGLLYDSSNLTVNAINFFNAQNGSVGSAGVLNINTGTPGNFILAGNEGQIWGNTVNLTALNGFGNGLDQGNPANQNKPNGSIFASGNLTITNGGNATIYNYGSLEAGGNLKIDVGNGSLQNTMSMVPDSELTWTLQGGPPVALQSGDLGFVMTGANGSSNKQHVTINGTTYYFFDQIGGSTQAYLDGQQTDVENQTLNVPLSSIQTPTIRAGGNLQINNFQSLYNVGTISGVGDVTLQGNGGSSSINNSSLKFGQRDQITQGTSQYTCSLNTGITNVAEACGTAGVNEVTFNQIYQTNIVYSPVRPGTDAFTGKILAGGKLNLNAGTLTNGATGASQGTATVTLPGAPVQTGAISIVPAARGGATTINVNGAQIALPTNPNGRFLTAMGSSTAPLIETNPLFGIDSAALGSEYLVKLLGLNPDQQDRRLGDDNYEDYLIGQQVASLTGRSVLLGYPSQDDELATLFDNAATEAKALNLGYGKALTSAQIASLKSDIIWSVEQVVNGQKVLVPVVYLSDATRASVNADNGPVLSGYDVNVQAGNVQNIGGNINAANGVNIQTTGDIQNLSGQISGWNVVLNAGGNIVNSTLVNRLGDAANGTDVAQRTASIEAGNSAVLQAAHDITVNGAWVTAAKDAALIAGNNVNVQSFALTTNSHNQAGGNYTTSQTQTAQTGGVVAGGDAVLQAGQDVNLKGATVSAGGTAVLNAQKGNVNVSALDLTNSKTTSQSSQELYLDTSSDAGTASASLSAGFEEKTTTHTDSTTTGAGSSVSGKQVVVTTGKGDVNIDGSSLTAGQGGLVIDSARNVNITAHNNTTQSTDSTNTNRQGIQLDANADGAYAGTKVSGDTNTTTTTQTTAQVSSLNSGGDLTILGKGTLTNQGTQIGATGDVALAAQNIVNQAAQNTLTTTTSDQYWESKQQVGLTTNGTGSSIAGVAQGQSDQVTVGTPEAQVRVTGAYSNDTNTSSQSTAVRTQINAGGNVTVVAQNSASDQGTQYTAGKNVVISAADYTNKAAADVTSTSDEKTTASGQGTVGVDATASVDVTLSAQGSHTTSSNTQSTARTGSINAGGAVVIEANKGDVTLEGTQINGTQGVGISAARNLNINQANDTTTATSTEQSGSAQASVSVSLVGAGGAVGAGANTRLANSNDTASTARTASINAGDGSVQLNAGENLTSQGASIAAAHDVALKAGGDVNLLAATDKKDNTGSVQAGGASVNVGFGTGAAKGDGSLGANVSFENGQTDYHETTQHGSTITAGGNFSLNAGGDGHLQGTQVSAGTASLKTGGDLTIESAQHTVTDNSYDIGGNVGISASKGQGTAGASSGGHTAGGVGAGGRSGGNAGGGNAQVNVALSKQNIDTNTNAFINTTGGTTVNVGKDLSLEGANINAGGGVSGKVAGNLNIITRTDTVNVDQTNVNAYAGVGPAGGTGSGGTTAQRVQGGASTALNHVAQTGAFTNVNSQKNDDVTVGTASGISGGAGGINLTVGGNTTLTGAANTGGDFHTLGQTTIQNVETHTNDSNTSFRVAGTVASLAGSNDGSGGNFGLVVHTPHAGGVDEPANNTTLEHDPRGGPVPTITADHQVIMQPPGGDRVPTNHPAPVPVHVEEDPYNTDPVVHPQVVVPPNHPAQVIAQGHPNGEPHVEDSYNTNEVVHPVPDNMPAHVVAQTVDANGVPHGNNHAPNQAPVDVNHPAPTVDGVINSDRRAVQMLARIANPDEAVKRNVAEAVAFTQIHPEFRDQLFAAIEDSLQGPTVRDDGLTLYPVQPQYVGENVPGFDHWKNRDPNAPPGASYAQSDEFIRGIKYFDAHEQEQARVYVGPDRKLVSAEGKPLNGNFIFVVDDQGRLLVTDRPTSRSGIHHSSLSGGKRVLMAGEFTAFRGKITVIKDQSGHFRPGNDSFKKFLVALQDQRADLDQAQAPGVSYGSGGLQPNGQVVTDNLLAERDVRNGMPNQMLAPMQLSPRELQRLITNANNAEHDAHPAQPPAVEDPPYSHSPEGDGNGPAVDPDNTNDAGNGNPPTAWVWETAWRMAA